MLSLIRSEHNRVRLACLACGAHVLVSAKLLVGAGRCGCCGGYELTPLAQRRHASVP
jgi:hypothetical protein